MRVLAGAITKDEGRIIMDGEELHIHGPGDSIQAGITMIYQELNLVPYNERGGNILLGGRFGKTVL